MPTDHKDQYPAHVVRTLGVKLTKPKPEQFKRRQRVALTQPGDVLPRKVDWRPIPKAAGITHFNQGRQGSCTANTACIDKAFQEVLRGTCPGEFSRAFVYYKERELHGWQNEDSGAMMEDEGIVLGTDGVCLDTTMPYNQFDYKTAPSEAAIEEAKDWTTDRDQTRLSWGDELMAALNEGPVMVDVPGYGPVPDGLPRVGIAIYSSFWNSEYNGGYVPIPKKGESLDGGHSVWAVGYDLDMVGPDGTQGYFILWGSWGELICAQGDHYVPIDYHKNVGDDSDTWQQFDQTPGPGPGPEPPEPTTCEEEYNEEMPKCFKLSDVFELLFCAFEKLITYWICAFGELAFQKAIRKKKTMQRTLRAKSGSKYRVAVTITEPKK